MAALRDRDSEIRVCRSSQQAITTAVTAASWCKDLQGTQAASLHLELPSWYFSVVLSLADADVQSPLPLAS